jgi:hypothetical protein
MGDQVGRERTKWRCQGRRTPDGFDGEPDAVISP